jgi:hypothetical protein
LPAFGNRENAVGAYSALVLAANSGLRSINPEKVRSLCEDLELIAPARRSVEYGNLAADISGLFDDSAAREENEWFFCPDSICCRDEIQILSYDGHYAGVGYCIRIHGNGYFFPWTADQLRARVLSHAKLVRLREELRARFGGRFRMPWFSKNLKSRVIDAEGGWVWFMSESL